ncbi:AMP-binding protein [Vibrio mangrovi]|uniref:AMP-binding protein n=1 Tax=Vibrio mangrovi TaxID=474394 RepID=A0A1Y6ISD9_9VIBR|nr:AMP-binding protein [Vibrio mangrovi]MDW6001389.1 AMP-binding protein [Vibrio mangrovi]SMS00589.1 D-alanine--poly(phosphoribitol) ligase subunit 1 [Vibrio mangrovi]
MFSNMMQAIIDRIHAQPEQVALVNRQGRVDFRTLGARTQAIADEIQQRQPNRVLIYGHKELDTFASMLACTLCGISFTVVDAANPTSRLLQVAAMHEADLLILGAESYLDQTLSGEAHFIAAHQPSVAFRFQQWQRGENPIFYVLSTSGSTGVPKGVMIGYDGFGHFYQWYRESLTLNHSGGAHVNHACLAFDMGILDCFPSLAVGKAVVMLPHEYNALPRQNIRLMTQEADVEVSSWFSTPSFLEMMCLDPKFNAQSLPGMRVFFVGGEFVPHQLIAKIEARFPQAQVLHAYGPTETTCVTHACPVTADDMRYSQRLSLGQPLGVNRIRIEDDDGQELPVGEIGEVVIYGGQVAHGYLPVSHPQNVAFGSRDGERFYRSGDFGYVDESGNLFLKGRKDGQIKWNGNRIELVEIENVAARCDQVRQSAVIPIYVQDKLTQLVMYVQLEQDTDSYRQTFEQFMHQHLPRYMVPSSVHFVTALPMSLHGKIDRVKLQHQWHEQQVS